MESNIDLKFESIDLDKVKKFKEDIDDKVESLKSEMEGPFEMKAETTIKQFPGGRRAGKNTELKKLKSKIPSRKK